MKLPFRLILFLLAIIALLILGIYSLTATWGILGLLAAFLLIYIAGATTGMYFFTKTPKPFPLNATPANYGLQYEAVSFPAAQDKLTIRGWFIPAINGNKQPVIIVVHGKDADRSHMLEKSVPLARQGFNLLLIDLRGHGTSEGKFTSLGYFEQRDVLGAIQFLKTKGFKPAHIGAFADSLGATTTLVTMGRTADIRAMVADSAFADLYGELKYATPLLLGKTLTALLLPGMLLVARVVRGIKVRAVSAEDAVKNLNSRKILLIHGERDTLVPLKNAYLLKQAAGENAALWTIPNAAHVEAYYSQPRAYTSRVVAFFQKELA